MLKKKSLGQHFLRSPHYLSKLAQGAEVRRGERVVEIGPGEGTLTAVLLSLGGHLLALEKDRRLIPLLKDTFGGKEFEVREEDALAFDPSGIGAYKLVGNIPYYITGALLRKFLSAKEQPSRIVFLIQKEVAQRIARDKKESMLSLSVKAYGTPKILGNVPRGAFSPPPKVDSSILQIKDISRKNFKSSAHEKRFFELVRAGFSHKRKLLAGNLRPVLGEKCSDMLERAGIPKSARAEDVHLEQWLRLASL